MIEAVTGQLNVSGHVCTCSEHRALEAAANNFWGTEAGVLRRIDGLAQDMCFRLVNNAFQMVANTNSNVEYLFWQIADDDKVCMDCLSKAVGGDGGFYRKNWFLPKMPAHFNCRCLWVLVLSET